MAEHSPLAVLRGLLWKVVQDYLPANAAPFKPKYTAEELEKLWFPTLTGATEQLIETKLGCINVTTGGKRDGPALVLWPSLMLKGSMWSGQYEHFRHQYRVVLIDSPGINKSEGLRKYIDLRDCKDVLVTILDTLKIDKCIFGGNSWGAMLAGVLPAWIPERIVGTIIVNGTASVPDLPESVLMIPVSELLMMCETVPTWWTTMAREAFASNAAEASNPEFMAYVGCVSREDPKSIAWALKGILLGRKDYHFLMRTIKDTPVLILSGAQDRQFSQTIAQRMADATATSKLVVMPDVGHLAARERPDLVNAEIEKWLKEKGIGAAST